MKLLRANMDTGELAFVPLAPGLRPLGGRGLISGLLLDEMDPAADAEGPENRLILCNGLLAGTPAPCSGRLSVGGKSPLTGTIKEANAGGTAGLALARLGLRGVVVTGRSESLRALVIGPDGATLEDASELAGLGTYATCERLRARHGGKASVVCIGPAGERGYLNSSVQVTDREGNPARAAARGGLGAVMGARGLKAVVLLEGADKPAFADARRFREACRAYVKALRAHPLTGEVFSKFGTAVLVDVVNEMGAMPTRNYREGRFEDAEGLSSGRIAALQRERGGAMTHACQAGCPIACSSVYHGPDGAYLTSGMEYETIALNGSNLGIGDIDIVAAIDRLCDDAGLDTMETGATVGVAIEAGLLPFGDGRRALDLVRQMAAGTPLGIEMGQGTARFGRLHGVWRVPTVKRQALAGYDPRALKGTGVTCATSPMGGDHTAGNTIGLPGLDPLSPKGQTEASRASQRMMAVFDCLGMCIFAGMPAADPAVFALLGDMLAGVYGGVWTPGDVLALGTECLIRERRFNRLAGIGPEEDDVPAFMREEPLKPHDAVFDVAREELETVLDFARTDGGADDGPAPDASSGPERTGSGRTRRKKAGSSPASPARSGPDHGDRTRPGSPETGAEAKR